MNQQLDLSKQGLEHDGNGASTEPDPNPLVQDKAPLKPGGDKGHEAVGHNGSADPKGATASVVTSEGPSGDPQPADANGTAISTEDASHTKITIVRRAGEDAKAVDSLYQCIAELQDDATSDPPPDGHWSQVWPRLVASLLSTGFGMPILASLATVLMYSTRVSWFLGGTQHWQPAHAVAYGLLITVVFWLVFAFVYAAAGFATLQQANINVYLDYRRQFWETVDSLPSSDQAPEHGDSVLTQARRGLRRIYAIMRQRSGVQWVMGYGYIELWQRLHDVQDLLATKCNTAEMISMGIYNVDSLRGSNIDNADLLLAQTRQAIINLDHSAASYLDQSVAGMIAASSKNPPPADQQPAAKPDMNAVAEAQMMIRQVNRVIVQYRDRKWAGLVAARNRLMRSTAYTGIFTLLLLAAVIIFHATPANVEAATIFYLVGVLFGGLFQRLYSDGTSNTEVEDYGLATAQLVQISLISGLAGIAGVVLAGLMPITTVVASSGGSAGASATAVLTSLPSIFSFNRLEVALPIAAVFGLTPGLLLSRLTQKASQLASDIASSQPTSHP